MTQPKYKIGDSVWMMEDNEIKEMIVCGVYKTRIAVSYDKDDYTFYFLTQLNRSGFNNPWTQFIKRGVTKWFARGRNGLDEFIVKSYLEDCLFLTKQDLINSL